MKPSSANLDRRAFWEERVRGVRAGDDLATVTPTGAPSAIQRYIHHQEERALRKVLPHLPPHGCLLDIGCGYGRWFPLLQNGRDVVGIEFVQPLVERARALHPDVPVALADATRIPFRDATFDMAVTVKVLQCLDGTDQSRAVREILRVLRPGGRAVFVELAVGELIEHITPIPHDQWDDLTQVAGGRVIRRWGHLYAPLERGIEWVRRRLSPHVKATTGSDGDSAAEGAEQPLRKAHHLLQLGVLPVAHYLEPLLEQLPPAAASHAVVLVEKRWVTGGATR